MANNPKKMADPTEAALSAIQEALNSQDQNDLTANHQDGMSDPFSGEPNESEQTANVAAADSSLIGSGDLADLAARAANDDQQSIGQVLQSLQRRPARVGQWVRQRCRRGRPLRSAAGGLRTYARGLSACAAAGKRPRVRQRWPAGQRERLEYHRGRHRPQHRRDQRVRPRESVSFANPGLVPPGRM